MLGGAAEALPPPGGAAAGGESAVDPSFEFDAPRFYDFERGSPADAGVDGWFFTSATKGLVSPPMPLSQATSQAASLAVSQVAAEAKAEAQRAPAKAAAAADHQAASTAAPVVRQVLSPITGNRQVAPKPAQAAAKPAQAQAAAKAGRPSAPVQAAAEPAAQHSQPSTSAAAPEPARAEAPRKRGREEAAAGTGGARKRPAPAAEPRPKGALAAPPPRQADDRRHRMRTRSMGGQREAPPRLDARQAVQGRAAPGAAAGKRGAAAPPARPPPPKQVAGAHKLTLPKSPSFQTKQRVRPPRFKPREEVEAEEMAAMPQFKARPVNKRMLQASAPPTGVPSAAPKPPTAPAPFRLATDQRAGDGGGGRGGKQAEEPSNFVFRAGATKAAGERVTRSRARPAPPGGITQPKPFNLATDTRGASKRAAQRGQQEQQEEELHLMQRPAKRARTVPAGPFNLRTDARAGSSRGGRGVEDGRQEQAASEARPLNRAAQRRPSCLPPAAQTLTVPVPIQLASDRRAAQRREFDAAVAQRAQQEEAEQEAARAAAAREEEAELRQYRRELEFHARPLPGAHGRE